MTAPLFADPTPRLAPSPLPKGVLSPARGAEGDVYLSTQGSYSPPEDSVVRAVDPETGNERWRARLSVEVVTAPVPSADGRTVWASGEAAIAAFSAETGEPQGVWGPGTRDCLDPVPVGGDRVAVANWNGRAVAALAPGRREPLWKTEVGHSYTDLAAGPGQVYASLYVDGKAGAVQALDSATGVPLWRHDTPAPVHVPPAAGPDGVVYVSGSEGSVAALDPQTGEELWRTPTVGRPATAAVSADGERVYVGDSAGTLLALDADTGERVWRIQTPGAVRHAPGLGADGTLCVTSGDRTVTLVDAERGLLQGQAELEGLSGGSPVPLEDGSFLVWTLAGRTERLSPPAEPDAPAETAEPLEIQIEDEAVLVGDIRVPRRTAG